MIMDFLWIYTGLVAAILMVWLFFVIRMFKELKK